MRNFNLKWYSICLLGYAILFTFLNYNVPFIYDDVAQIQDNVSLHGFNLFSIITEPLRPTRVFQNITFAINWVLSNGQPWSFHFFNNLLHSANTFLFVVLLPLIGINDKRVILFSGLLFLIHPLNIEGVTYIMGRVELLKTFSTLLLLIAYIKNKNKWLIFIGLSFSVFIKETCILTPIFFIAYDVICDKKHLNEINWKNHLLFISHVVFFLGSRLLIKDIHRDVVGFSLYPVIDYLLTNISYLYFYLYLFFNPAEQSIIHSWIPASLLDVILGMLCYAILIFTFFKLFKTKSALSFLIFFFFISFLPNFSFLQFVNPFAEYRLYQSNLTLVALLITTLFSIPLNETIRYLFFSIFVFYYSFFHTLYLSQWKNSASLWAYALEKYPTSVVAGVNLARVYNKNYKCFESIKKLDQVCSNVIIPDHKLSCESMYSANYMMLLDHQKAYEHLTILSKAPKEKWISDFYKAYLMNLEILGKKNEFDAFLEKLKKVNPEYANSVKWTGRVPELGSTLCH